MTTLAEADQIQLRHLQGQCANMLATVNEIRALLTEMELDAAEQRFKEAGGAYLVIGEGEDG
jgi:hypothetical protein